MLQLLDRATRSALRLQGCRQRTIETSAGAVAALETTPRRGGGHYVLLHGLGTSAAGYVSVIRRLARHADRVVALDLPGHGHSDRFDAPLTVERLREGLQEALSTLVERPAVFLGTSLGGAAALQVALERPDWVASLVLASPAGAPLDDDELAELRARFDLRRRRDARAFFEALLHRPPMYMRLLEPGLLAQLSSPEVRSFLEHLSSDAFFEPDALQQLAVPTTVLWGRSDAILPRSGLAFFRRTLPETTRFVEVDGVGHSPHVERPSLIADAMRSAWDEQLGIA